ncbi:cupredoxin domain-containing protein [Coralliovum pocilloporae]|uniref:cupredoxin domain-containing protein n=1 Tax=Coralliovum pocilloporae TaxID=3066369 RepID=UPI00330712F8
MKRRDLLAGTAASLFAAGLSLPARATMGYTAENPVHHMVTITGFVFEPAHLTVRPGDRITWTNLDIAPHTATARDHSWDTGQIDKDQSATVTVTEDMVLDYYCRYHPIMEATLAFKTEG